VTINLTRMSLTYWNGEISVMVGADGKRSLDCAGGAIRVVDGSRNALATFPIPRELLNRSLQSAREETGRGGYGLARKVSPDIRFILIREGRKRGICAPFEECIRYKALRVSRKLDIQPQTE